MQIWMFRGWTQSFRRPSLSFADWPRPSVIVCRKQDHKVGGGLTFWMIWKHFCCRKGDPFPGLRVGSCQTLGNGLSEEAHVLIKQKILLGRGTRAESSRVREPRRTALHAAPSLGFYGNGVSFRVVSGQSSCLARSWSDSGSFPVARASLSQDGSSVMVSGGWQGMLSSPSSFRPLPNSPG